MPNKKYQNIDLSFNLVMSIGEESCEILNTLSQYLDNPSNNYLAPHKFLAINGKQDGLADNILTYQAQYNDITDIYLYIQKADFIFLIIDQLDKSTISILTKISLLNQNIILFVRPAQTHHEHQYLKSLTNTLTIYVSQRENKQGSALKMTYSVISIINLINKKALTGVDFPDLYLALSKQAFSYLGVSIRTNSQSVEELTKLALFDAQTNLKKAQYLIVFISADNTFSIDELNIIWNIIDTQTNVNVTRVVSFDLVENCEHRINYIGMLVAGN